MNISYREATETKKSQRKETLIILKWLDPYIHLFVDFITSDYFFVFKNKLLLLSSLLFLRTMTAITTETNT